MDKGRRQIHFSSRMYLSNVFILPFCIDFYVRIHIVEAACVYKLVCPIVLFNRPFSNDDNCLTIFYNVIPSLVFLFGCFFFSFYPSYLYFLLYGKEVPNYSMKIYKMKKIYLKFLINYLFRFSAFAQNYLSTSNLLCHGTLSKFTWMRIMLFPGN